MGGCGASLGVMLPNGLKTYMIRHFNMFARAFEHICRNRPTVPVGCFPLVNTGFSREFRIFLLALDEVDEPATKRFLSCRTDVFRHLFVAFHRQRNLSASWLHLRMIFSLGTQRTLIVIDGFRAIPTFVYVSPKYLRRWLRRNERLAAMAADLRCGHIQSILCCS